MNTLLTIGLSFGAVALIRMIFEQKNRKVPGTGFSLKHLQSIFPDILFWNLQEQARYADHICQHMVAEANLGAIVERTELEGVIADALRNPDHSRWSSTSIGNIAYITLHSKDSAMRKAGKLVLDQAKEYFNNKKAAA